MAEFQEPLSRNEAILQNMFGAENDLGEPQSRIEALLMRLLEVMKTIEGWPEMAALAGKTILEVADDGE